MRHARLPLAPGNSITSKIVTAASYIYTYELKCLTNEVVISKRYLPCTYYLSLPPLPPVSFLHHPLSGRGKHEVVRPGIVGILEYTSYGVDAMPMRDREYTHPPPICRRLHRPLQYSKNLLLHPPPVYFYRDTIP